MATTNTRTKMMILTALFSSLTALGAFWKIPIPPVPVTLQIFFVVMAGLVLGSHWGLVSQLVYLAVGLCGIPIFTAGGGPAYIFQPTFGYLIGFAVAAWLAGWIVERTGEFSFRVCFAASMAGLLASLVIGTLYMYLLLNLYLHTPQTIWTALLSGFIPFIIGDTVLMAVVSVLSLQVLTRLHKAGLYHPPVVK
ncbi:MAG: biotin transporter BioY [Eubacteriales bacterium]|jgi:biotin transport system substrate-specific component